MESFNNVLCMVTPNCYMGTIDLKDAYYTVPISNSDRKYMRFIWNEKLWENGFKFSSSCFYEITQTCIVVIAFKRPSIGDVY